MMTTAFANAPLATPSRVGFSYSKTSDPSTDSLSPPPKKWKDSLGRVMSLSVRNLELNLAAGCKPIAQTNYTTLCRQCVLLCEGLAPLATTSPIWPDGGAAG
ncbi:hypothetical protein ZHAS_00015696 [Anopheles sinensis]|uniref:Uncharacterized protein n=1 Tax=Anopheles sinensis TaxID=74873 RepID=A0A084WBQ9_ANOSI|nr:hypothetical protein ZHAS_00015696 [Anopheles sinensis]